MSDNYGSYSRPPSQQRGPPHQGYIPHQQQYHQNSFNTSTSHHARGGNRGSSSSYYQQPRGPPLARGWNNSSHGYSDYDRNAGGYHNQQPQRGCYPHEPRTGGSYHGQPSSQWHGRYPSSIPEASSYDNSSAYRDIPRPEGLQQRPYDPVYDDPRVRQPHEHDHHRRRISSGDHKFHDRPHPQSLLKSSQMSEPPPLIPSSPSTRSSSAKRREDDETTEHKLNPKVDAKIVSCTKMEFKKNEPESHDEDSDSDALVIDIAEEPRNSPEKNSIGQKQLESFTEKFQNNSSKQSSSQESIHAIEKSPKSFKIPKRKSDEKNPPVNTGSPMKSPKFDQVEDALAAMFAGVSGESDAPTSKDPPSKSSSSSSSKSKSTPKAVNFKTSSSSKKKTGGRKSKPESRAFTPPPSIPNGSHRLITKSKRKVATTAQEILLERYKGPFVRIEGDPNSPSWCHVINSSSDPITETEESSAQKSELEQKVRASGFGNLATNTLSSRYDAKKPDETWLCVFCKRGSHFGGSGDLFGPYTVSREVMNSVIKRSPTKSNVRDRKESGNSKQQDLAAKFIIGDPKSKQKHRRKFEGLDATPVVDSPLQQIQQQPSVSGNSDGVEIWFHEDCICWMPCIKIVGHLVTGLDEAIRQSHQEICSSCQQTGSTLGCVHTDCRETSHYLCAHRSGWMVDDENFHALCPQHATRNI